MYRGDAVNVTLRGNKKIADAVMDAFGSKTMIMPLDEDHFTANVYVEVSPTFFAWVSTFGGKLAITNPPEVKVEMVEFLSKSLDAHNR